MTTEAPLPSMQLEPAPAELQSDEEALSTAANTQPPLGLDSQQTRLLGRLENAVATTRFVDIVWKGAFT